MISFNIVDLPALEPPINGIYIFLLFFIIVSNLFKSFSKTCKILFSFTLTLSFNILNADLNSSNDFSSFESFFSGVSLILFLFKFASLKLLKKFKISFVFSENSGITNLSLNDLYKALKTLTEGLSSSSSSSKVTPKFTLLLCSFLVVS